MPGPGNYQSQSLARGIQVLCALAASSKADLADLHEQTHIPKSTLVRLLAVLTELGCTRRLDDRPTYELGPTVVEIAAGLDHQRSPEEIARPYLTDLVTRLGHTANLGVLDGNKVLHLGVVLADRPVRYTAHSGTRDDVWCTGLGKALLAYLPRTEAAEILQGQRLTKRTDRTITTRSRLWDELATTRARGWSYDDQEGALGLACFAVPVLREGECVAAVSVSGPAGELPFGSSNRVVPELMISANQLADSLPLMAALRGLRD